MMTGTSRFDVVGRSYHAKEGRMTNTEAIIELMRDARTERSSRASYKRVCKALNALDDGSLDRIRILQYMEYCDGDGKLYPFYLPKDKP
jgi:hypothetical protein